MRRVAAALRHRVGHRGSALLFFAALDAVYSVSLLFPGARDQWPESLRWLDTVLPLWVWALAWGAVGAVCGWQAFRRRDQVAFACAIGIKVMWGLVSLGGWLVGGVERGYVSAAVWLVFAAFVGIIASWPEPPHGWKERTWTQPSA
jgi:hypothetical protein